ncbi:MAG: hypothetical protein A2942_00515 [Candidatus Lloydbacteria bacterium RIFCSPLOWO2_01_FULL_50_20]|uniref:nicotinate-nucleotide adenylyltransferase n=1 Tax=Candidatus Lloydbacteria bacterium RIFCSPLOWO2_01_FULL_50_20 TaxID=1798665 RepID=A0A1G2DCW7_9BACT|nr:MAG: hypothetical protein A3C13_02125 [Candidatus Lloydbacteria bacterium RIFCSPHIGHO2_02_FULL_50_11]OGZ11262.1 MAG: hypothetical protein A2942_00515 [Candidatus Lloydbacteria bacterium RIFCSPLOWO2_01_FULL_50_20]
MRTERAKRIAVVGSAANPVTKAHREFAEVLTESGRFDLILWLPSGSRLDKPDLVSSEHRVCMTELAFNEAWRKKQPTKFEIDLREARGASIPTAILLREFEQEYPDAEIIFATGVDVLVPRPEYGGKCEVLHHWREGESLMKNWTFVVLPREGYPHPRLLQEKGEIPAHFIVLERTVGDISSTEIRRRIAHGEPFDDLVDPPVAEYIRAHKLYQ